MHYDEVDDDRRWSRAWIAGVGLMLVLTAMVPAGQAAVLRTQGDPCASVSNEGVSVGECNTGGSMANDFLTGNHPTASGAYSFDGVNATAVLEDVRVTWTFNESAVDANVTAFHVERGLSPGNPGTMTHVATTGPSAETYVDRAALLGGDAVWYVVTAELADGSVERSQPVRVSGASTG